MSELHLERGQAAMLGYGSLLSQASMELTFGARYPYPRVPCALSGWRRSWDVMMPNKSFYERNDDGEFVPQNIVYLNVRRDPGALMNGILYVVNPLQLAEFDRREWIYDRVDVSADIRECEVDGPVWMYVGKREWVTPAAPERSVAAIRQTYLDIIESGLGELGEQFRASYEESTDRLPRELIFADRKRDGSHATLADGRSA